MKQPGRRKIRIFLDTVERLDRFEATQRAIRGIGAGFTGPMPVPEVVEVIAWLKHLSNPNRRDIDGGQVK